MADDDSNSSNSSNKLSVPDEQITEYQEDEQTLTKKIKKLARWVKNSKHMVFYTGAGISTSANIPDFRGPNGIWTKRDKGELPPVMDKALSQVEPTPCHMGMVELIKQGKLKYITSQNVDGLHLKSGVPPANLAELHGNCFLEVCEVCHLKYFRSFSVTEYNSDEINTSQMSWGQLSHMTGRRCKVPTCKGILRDSIINFGENLPTEELTNARDHGSKSDLAVCWGSSMSVSPACDIPEMARENEGGKMVIINMQKTKKDKRCDLRIFAKVDVVMNKLMEELGYTIPKFGNQYYKQSLDYGHSVAEGKTFVMVKGGAAGSSLCFFGLEKVLVITPNRKVILRYEPFKLPIENPGQIILHIHFYGIRKPLRVVHTITNDSIITTTTTNIIVDFGELAAKKSADEEKEVVDEASGEFEDENDENFGKNDSVCALM